MPNYSESLPELFRRVTEAKTKEDKIGLLRQYKNTQALHTVLQGAFDPRVTWNLPEGTPPYKKDDSPYGLSPSVLEKEIRKLVYFLPGRLIQNRMKREEVFVQILESIHPSESELLIQMKDKRIDGLTARLIWEAIPELFPEPPEPVVVSKKKTAKKKTAKNE